MALTFKNKDEIAKMRVAGRVVRQVLNTVTEHCKPGVTTKQLDELAPPVIEAAGGKGLFKNYPGPTPFPANLCISVNEQVVHGIGGDRVIQDGDIVSVDCGVSVDGWCGDAATTILVGDVPKDARKVCEVTQHVLQIAVENIRPGRRWSQVARLMQNYAESHGMGVVRDYVGHGIGQNMHEDPKIPNFVSPELIRRDIHLREGMVMAIEPMCNFGTHNVRTLDDQWTVVTADNKPSAHYEHTIAVTATGSEVLTDGN